LRLIRLLSIALALFANGADGQQEFKTTVQPLAGENLRGQCSFELWVPGAIRRLRSVWITYDRGYDITRYYTDAEVRTFAEHNAIALMLARQCPAKVPPTGEQGEMDMDMSRGVARSIFAALDDFARQSDHPEISSAKLILLGFSGIGAMFGHLVQYAPDRVVAAILANPGQTDPYGMKDMNLSADALRVPQFIIVGGIDDHAGTQLPFDYFKRHRARGAPWVFLLQNGVPHCCVINAKDLILEWLREIIRLRKPAADEPLRPIDARNGWVGFIRPCGPNGKDSKGEPLWNVCAASVQRGHSRTPNDELPAAWFPTNRLALDWLTFIREQKHPLNSFPGRK
jgi:dienelactone hydrolase